MAYIEKVVTATARQWFDGVADAPLDDQIEVIRSDIAVSTNTSEMVLRGTGLNITNLQGRRVLDLASGLSTFVVEANQHGVETIGVDTAYASLAELEARGIEYDARGYYKFMGDTSRFTSSNLDQLNRMLDYLNSGGPRNDCLRDMAENPSRYVAGSVLDLPFADKSFDLVVSNSLLTSEPGLSGGFTEATVLEALRVLKKQGELRIGPIDLDTSPDKGKTKEVNIRAAFEKAKQEKLAEKFSKISIGKNEWAYAITRSRKR